QSGACRVQPTEGRAMVADVPGAIGRVAEVAPGVQGWPARSVAYYGLTVIILATALNFLDAQIFSMMAQHIKGDFHLTDEQLGFLLGPANIVFYVLVGIPLARLVDLYPRKYVLAGGITLIGGITALGGLAQNFVQLFMSRMLVGAPGFVIAGLLLFATEPPRRGLTVQGQAVPMKVVLREIWTRRSIYLPLFIGLAFSATEFLGLGVWRPAFLARTYGWNSARI